MEAYNRIIFTNDFHSNVPESISFLEQLLAYRKAGGLLIDVGDFSEGNSFHEFSQGTLERVLMHKIYDILIPGNHGFSDVLKCAASQLVVNCNIEGGAAQLFNKVVIKQVNEARAAITGIMSNDAFLSIPAVERKNMQLMDPVQSILDVRKSVAQEIDYLIVCSHSGIDFDRKTLAEIHEVDVILSSHCHSLGVNFDSNHKHIRKAQENGKSIGLIEMNKNKIEFYNRVIENRGLNFTTKEFEELNNYLSQFNTEFDQAVAAISSDSISLLEQRELLVSRLLNTLIEDLQLENVRYLVNYTFLRTTKVSDNNLTKKNLTDLIPFDTRFLVLKLPNANHIHDYSANIPQEILDTCLIFQGLSHNEKNFFITTDYLYSNFYPKGEEEIYESMSVKDLLIRALN